ncbi:MAG TPA: hypothetical protein VIV58_00685 [Kofleriaceae bacterium]
MAESQPEDDKKKPEEHSSKFGVFLQKYATLLSSTVLGIAGLAATSIWQCRQSATTAQQAAAQQRVAEMQAENSWKIERADILSKNIATLASNAPDSAEQRYGVLLSLTRGNLLDPELAVSYALELGKDNAEYMQSVLATVPNKDYARIARAFTLSCADKYGVSPNVPACNDDKLAQRSAAITRLIADDADTTLGTTNPGPLQLLREERPVQLHILRMVALFAPFLAQLYEDRKWDSIAKFEASSNGAKLVAALALSAAHTGEFVTDAEAKQLQQFHDAHTKWLAGYLAGTTCDAECKSRTISVMLSHFAAAQGSFDAAVREILEMPRPQSGMAVSFMHTRLLWCQIDDPDLAALRDHVLVPAAIAVLGNAKADPSVREGILGLLLLMSEPTGDDAKAAAAWQTMIVAVDKAGDSFAKAFRDHKATAAKQRQNPPPKFKNLNFCGAPAAGSGAEPEHEHAP